MYISLDLGSTNFKAGVFDDGLNLQGTARHILKYADLPDNRIELDAEEVNTGIREIAHEALLCAGIGPQDIKSVSVASQAQTFIILDNNDVPKTRFISWQDMSAVNTEMNLPDFADHSSFGIPFPGLQVCLLKHIQDTQPGFIAEDDSILKLPSYIIRNMTGKSYLDNNLASMSGLFSLKTGFWWKDALLTCRLKPSQLPDICPVGTVAAITNKDAEMYGLPVNVPVISAGNDQTAGAYGTEIHRSGSLLITLGTAQVAYQCLSRMPLPSSKLVRGPYPYGLFYRMAADSAGGNVINWAKDIVTSDGSYDTFFSLAASSPSGCRGVKFIFDDRTNQGCWQPKGEPSDLARSVLECLSKRMANLMEELAVNLDNVEIVCGGGGSKKQIWLDILSAEVGKKLQTTQADPLLGAAMMAAKS